MNTSIKRVMASLGLCAMFATPTVAWANTVHKAERPGVKAWSNDKSVYANKTEANGKGVFARYTSGGVSGVTGVTSTVGETVSRTTSGLVTAVSACISNGVLPSTCSAPNNVK